jgi:hypothetical protein
MRSIQMSGVNSRKHEALAAVRSGRMSIPQAARFAHVSLRSMVGWCRVEHIPVPPEHEPEPVRRPPEELKQGAKDGQPSD